MYLSSVPFDQVGFDTTLQKEPILNNAKEFLATVPMVLSIWPALFMGFHILSTHKHKDGGSEGPDHHQEGDE